MFVRKARRAEYHCGASLVSAKVILSAGHCINLGDDTLLPTEVVLYVGQYNLKSTTANDYDTPIIKEIIVHPDYKQYSDTSFDADIALILLKYAIADSPFVRPVCLWQGSIKIDDIVSHSGTVVGWGRDQNGHYTNIPNRVEMPIVSQSTCLQSHREFQYYSSNRTFCAGKRDTGVAPCNGDSGGPFTIFNNGRWYLRGIVSVGLKDHATNKCDVNNYVMFTDVAQFLPWIESYF